ncbi:Transglutaminase-like enzyme, putative cysteine protease [Halogranum rubrum]|uniref:Transglutaminase-like enzyme, putative cysteine protease n=1 Tax=Halogranum rubrum TaxID=553466 RepID=A0A1I4B296_9EURY|nr:transglutaminase domain-containing protein [Halogranum rubrum]SFK62915.1 Transglutaminase-like enzyme, putative cysteine protease [Halogranum rubrum]
MPDRSPPPKSRGREYGRALLVLCCAAALVLAASLVPALAGSAPADALVFVEGGSDGDSSSGGRSGLGALDNGNRTDVGGSLGNQSDNAFQSLGTETHFTVQSTTGAYWRTGSYDRYTGSGWTQTGDSRPYDGSVDLDGLRDTEVSYEVTLERSATSLPTVWMPQRVSLDEQLRVTPGGALRATESVPAETTYTGQSVTPPSDPALLRSAGRDYPPDVADQYTRLPDSTPDRLTAFTDELTADANSPYEKAVRIERWLEANKTYSLDASHDTGADVADQFVFEMDEGYCEYFATTMVTMLRSQDVPARYAVGYSTGQQTDENSYTVRGMNAHAWVEVYFPDVGWVQFDPTPGAARLQEEQEAFEASNENGSYAPTEQGSPGETSSINESSSETPGEGNGPNAAETPPSEPSTPASGEGTATESPETTDSADQPQPSGYALDLNTTPVPGRSVNVTVTNDGVPVSGVTVLFNDEPVGTTDRHGSVVATVPYTTEFTVSLAGRDVERQAALGAPPRGDLRYALDAPPVTLLESAQSNQSAPEGNTSQSYRLDTNVSLSLTGEPVTGNEITLAATIRGVPVRDAAVELDGEQVTTTDDRGRAQVTLPDESGNVTLAVSRDEAAGAETLTVRGLGLAVEPALPLSLPLQPVVVQARLGNQSLAGATVSIDGESVGETTVNGTLRPDLPFRDSVTVSVSKYGQTREQQVTGLYTNAALVAFVPGLLLVGLGISVVRRGVTPRSALRVLSRLADRLLRTTLATLVGFAAVVDSALHRAVDAARHVVATLRALLERRRALDEVLGSLRAWLLALVASNRTRIREASRRVTPTSGGPSTPAEEDSRTIREAWGRFLAVVSIPRARTKSPGEIATHAITVDELPSDPVETLRDVFREVEYGGRDASERLPRVEAAITAIEAHLAARRDGPDAETVERSDETSDTPEASGSTDGTDSTEPVDPAGPTGGSR